MKRRSFLRETSFGAIAITTTGFISFNGTKYVGDCQTTTDMLGPFYRPGSPERTSLIVQGDNGTKILLAGKVKHDDCVTPLKKAKVEIWHCSPKGEYDNDSNDFRYRATTYTDDRGNYSFSTILPIPYRVSQTTYRPAHFHLMITADNYQPLVTQVYFEGDKHLTEDSASSSPTAKKRILKVQTLADNSKKVSFDINLSKSFKPEVTEIDKLQGTYSFDHDRILKFFLKEEDLWCGNPEGRLAYAGANTFHAVNRDTAYTFQKLTDGRIRLEEKKEGVSSISYKT